MERLFSPCTRLYDTLENQGRLEAYRGLFQELNLDVSTEELLSAETAFTFADLHAVVVNGDTIAWLTPHASILRLAGRAAGCVRILDIYEVAFTVDGKAIVIADLSVEALSEICDVVLRLLAVSVVRSVCLSKWSSGARFLINAPTLVYLTEQCQSLKDLQICAIDLDENHCRVFGAYSRPDLKVELDACRIGGAAAEALVEVLGRNQGPTKLFDCDIDNSVLANGLRGNSRLKSLLVRRLPDNRGVGHQVLLAIAGALKENKGLVDLDLQLNFPMSDGTWDAVCDSLKTHPTLEVFKLRMADRNTHTGRLLVTPDVITSRVQALLNMLKVNRFYHCYFPYCCTCCW